MNADLHDNNCMSVVICAIYDYPMAFDMHFSMASFVMT